MTKGTQIDIQDFLDEIDGIIAELSRYSQIPVRRFQVIRNSLREFEDLSESFIRRCVGQQVRIGKLLLSRQQFSLRRQLMKQTGKLIQSIPTKFSNEEDVNLAW